MGSGAEETDKISVLVAVLLTEQEHPRFQYRLLHWVPNQRVSLPSRSFVLIPNVKFYLLGIYHGLGKKHLQCYFDEFAFRFNRCFWLQPLFYALSALWLLPTSWTMVTERGNHIFLCWCFHKDFDSPVLFKNRLDKFKRIVYNKKWESITSVWRAQNERLIYVGILL